MTQSRPIRSFVKGLCWEIISNLTSLALAYLVFGNWELCITFFVVSFVLKTCMYFIHERIWKKTSWGRL